MKSRTVIILWAVALVLGITAAIVKFGGSDENATRTKLAPGEKLLSDYSIPDITGVSLTQGKNITTLTRLSEEEWGVAERSNYPINYEMLRNLLGALGELDVTQGYPSTSENFGRFGLSKKSDKAGEEALHITMTAKDGSNIAEVYLGKYSGSSRAGGRFVRIASDDSGVYAVGETFPGITAAPKDWLNKDFLKIENIQSVAVSAPSDPGFTAWKLARHPKTDGSPNPKGQLTLVGMTDKELMKLTSTNPLINLFSYSAFQDILSEKEAAETAKPDVKLKRQAVITTHDGFSYTLVFWPQKEKPKDPDADPRLPELQPSYLLTIDVSTDFPAARTKATDEKPEDAKTKDAEFATQQKALKEKLAAAEAFKGRIYQISQSTIAPLQKNRSDFVTVKKATATTPPVRVPVTPRQPMPLQPLPPSQ